VLGEIMEQGKILLSWTLFAFCTLMVSSMVLQSVSVQKEKQIRRANAESVQLDKELVKLSDELSRLQVSNILQGAQIERFPKFQKIKISETININEIPLVSE
jgi:hypothetical protein